MESLKTKDIEWADMVFATAMLVQKDGERKEFWRFFSQALIKHHDKIAETLRLAAMGYHFRKLNDAYSDPLYRQVEAQSLFSDLLLVDIHHFTA